MERARVTVEYSHLPGQIFEHQTNGLYCRTADIDGLTPEDLKLAPVLEALENTLEHWRAAGGTVSGFPPDVTRHPEEFRLVVPRTVYFDVWPTTLYCNNRQCGRVVEAKRIEELPPQRRCPTCGIGFYQQLPYFRVHACGNIRELIIPECGEHPGQPVAFQDSTSFHTAAWRCLQCRRPLEMVFRKCPCRMLWRNTISGPAERAWLPVTARDSRAYFGHHLTLVSLGGTRLTQALRSPYGVHYALGHYAGTVAKLTGLEDEAAGRRRQGGAEATEALRLLREQYPNLSDEILKPLIQAVDVQRGDTPALEETSRLLAKTTIEQARTDRRTMERAFLFAQYAVDGLPEVSTRLRAAGHLNVAQRIDDGCNTARRLGLDQISVVGDFPVALVGYGFTREHSTAGRAQLLPLPFDKKSSDKLPLVTVETRTEGLLLELDAITLWDWCARNGWSSPPPAEISRTSARGWVLDRMFTEPESGAATAIRRVTHAYSHILVLALANHSSYSSNSVAEYLLEREASTLVYVAKYTSFNLGGLTALAEQHLQRWLEAATDNAWSCVHDPVCLSERGGCHKCLAVAFGCERFNKGLDRGYLVGGGPQDIAEGFLFTANRRHATSA
jgi:hypothetical protein